MKHRVFCAMLLSAGWWPVGLHACCEILFCVFLNAPESMLVTYPLFSFLLGRLVILLVLFHLFLDVLLAHV